MSVMPLITMHVLKGRKNKSDDERQTALDRHRPPHQDEARRINNSLPGALWITRLTEALERKNVNAGGISLAVQDTFRLDLMSGLVL